MRIAGVRVDPKYVRLLAEIVADAGYDRTAAALTEAIGLQVSEPPLTVADHEAILAALGKHCPGGLNRLRTELHEDHLRRLRAQGT